MDKLLSAVLDAHGGLQNWAGTTRITAQISLGGPLRGARGWPDVYSRLTVTIDPHREHIRFEPFTWDANHNASQVFYYDEKFMQRRMDYSPDVTGSPPVAHYTHEPRVFDGFVFPTRRRVHLHDEHGVANQEFAPITMDVDSVRVERRSS